MRFLTRATIAAAIGAGATALVAIFSRGRLADAPVRGRLAPDAVGTALSAAAFVIALGAFAWLGRSIAPDAGSGRAALGAGAFAGALTGLASAIAQSLALADYLQGVLANYAVPEEFLFFALGAYIVIAVAVTAVIGAVVSYAGWYRRPGRPR
ncbi:MAG TPA: hypothetical protein VHG53_03950 [Candidatus Limnocylindria bacterium]|nr:hypothetical protein [Candidatus Limnocylindria bacterium]